MLGRHWGALGIVLGLCLSAPARAEGPAPKTAAVGQENFGMGAGIGFFNPNGLVLRGGARVASLELSGGFAPALLSYENEPNKPRLLLIAPLEGSSQLVID